MDIWIFGEVGILSKLYGIICFSVKTKMTFFYSSIRVQKCCYKKKTKPILISRRTTRRRYFSFVLLYIILFGKKREDNICCRERLFCYIQIQTSPQDFLQISDLAAATTASTVRPNSL